MLIERVECNQSLVYVVAEYNQYISQIKVAVLVGTDNVGIQIITPRACTRGTAISLCVVVCRQHQNRQYTVYAI